MLAECSIVPPLVTGLPDRHRKRWVKANTQRMRATEAELITPSSQAALGARSAAPRALELRPPGGARRRTRSH
jgi:hypothetical protein